jgi:hypothetical protein
MSFKKNLTSFAQKELELIGLMEIPVGNAILTLLEESIDATNGNTKVMKNICDLLPALIDKKVISPITEDDFELETYGEGDNVVEILRCTRYPYVYKINGKYYDDRAIAFRKIDSAETDRMYIYQSGTSSKQEIKLPYLPSYEVKIID